MLGGDEGNVPKWALPLKLWLARRGARLQLSASSAGIQRSSGLAADNLQKVFHPIAMSGFAEESRKVFNLLGRIDQTLIVFLISS
jgi:hypothetical protein